MSDSYDTIPVTPSSSLRHRFAKDYHTLGSLTSSGGGRSISTTHIDSNSHSLANITSFSRSTSVQSITDSQISVHTPKERSTANQQQTSFYKKYQSLTIAAVLGCILVAATIGLCFTSIMLTAFIVMAVFLPIVFSFVILPIPTD